MVVLRRHSDQSVCLAHLGGKVGLLDGFARIVRREIEDGVTNRLALKSELVMFTTGIGGTARLLATCDRKPPYNSSAMMAGGPTVERERRECVGPEIDNHASIHRTGRFCCATMRRTATSLNWACVALNFVEKWSLDDPL